MAKKARQSTRGFNKGSSKPKKNAESLDKRNANKPNIQNGFKFGDSTQDIKDYINTKVDGTNEFGWYNKCGNLIEDSAKVNFYSVLGNKTPMNDDGLVGALHSTKRAIPGIMVFNTVTTPGRASDAHSPFNLAAMQMFEKERSLLNKLNPNYEFPDLGILMGAFTNVYVQYMNLNRLFGLLNSWDANSKYTPYALVKALYHINYANFQNALANKANLISRFNSLLKYARQFVYYPEDYAIATRQAWLFGKVFRDHETMKSQLYAFAMQNYYKWDEKQYNTGSALIYNEFWSPYQYDVTVEHYLDIFEECVDALRSSTSINDMVSDLRHAYDDRMMLAMADMTDDFMVVPDPRDDHALMQIENLISYPFWDRVHALSKDVTQNPDKNLIVYRPHVLETESEAAYTRTKMAQNFYHYINLHNDSYGIEEVTEATRLKPLILESDLGEGILEIEPTAELVVGISVVIDPQTTPMYINQWQSTDELTGTDSALVRYALSSFDWCPAMILLHESENIIDQSWIVQEWDRYAEIGRMDGSNQFLQQLNRVCMLSLWFIPETGQR